MNSNIPENLRQGVAQAPLGPDSRVQHENTCVTGRQRYMWSPAVNCKFTPNGTVSEGAREGPQRGPFVVLVGCIGLQQARIRQPWSSLALEAWDGFQLLQRAWLRSCD